MLSEYFEAPERIRAIRAGPAGESIEAFAERLYFDGYARITARRHISAAEHLVHWARRRGLSVADLNDLRLKQFDEHLGHCRCGRYAAARRGEVLNGARLFLRHLQGVGVPTVRTIQPTPVEPELLRAFSRWMREHRGTSDLVLYNYSLPLRALLTEVGEDLRKLDAGCLRQFVLAQSQQGQWVARRCRSALRMFLRFLIAEGLCRGTLLGAIPVVANWRLASLPRYLPAADVERLVGSCDRSTPIGRRDRAILLLIARLGLRAGDIVQMRLDDIDWKSAWLYVSGKSRQQTRLPLTQEVGDAIAAYIQSGRPTVPADALFLRSRAPFRALGSHCAVSVIVGTAFQRTEINRPCRGAAHLLRHSVASSMLRHGASLQEISVLLRHRSVETTQIYAKVDVAGLRQVAQPWPGVQPC
ncbi:MAG: tyrosine-type recombinase/integrase [Sterolibacteriaceae bacterium]|nr:tyrosine-type recombinase/integrase [Sterolibacteriaceae bacterium]MBP9034973.1 tyrosine-type recombinase/integrase [Pseudomonadales bacterium]